MDYDEHSQSGTQSQEYEPSLADGVFWIVDDERVVIQKRGLCLLEGHPVLAQVGGGLDRIPLEPDVVDVSYIVCTMYLLPRNSRIAATFSGTPAPMAGS